MNTSQPKQCQYCNNTGVVVQAKWRNDVGDMCSHCTNPRDIVAWYVPWNDDGVDRVSLKFRHPGEGWTSARPLVFGDLVEEQTTTPDYKACLQHAQTLTEMLRAADQNAIKLAEQSFETIEKLNALVGEIEQKNNHIAEQEAKIEHLAAENERLQQIAWLIGVIFVHGDFVAETINERRLEQLLRENGTFWETSQQLDEQLRRQFFEQFPPRTYTPKEPVAWEFRLRIRNQGDPWSEWHRCSAQAYEDYSRNCDKQWEYETRALFDRPQVMTTLAVERNKAQAECEQAWNIIDLTHNILTYPASADHTTRVGEAIALLSGSLFRKGSR